jgi:hypothetical protein
MRSGAAAAEESEEGIPPSFRLESDGAAGPGSKIHRHHRGHLE